MYQNIRNPLAGEPIAIGIAGIAHLRVFLWILQKPLKALINHFFVRTHQLQCPGSNALWAFRGVSHNEDRLAQGRRFLLNAAGVRQDQIAAG